MLNSLISATAMKYTEKIVSKIGFMKSLVLGEFLNRVFTSMLIFVQSATTPVAMSIIGGGAFGVREVASEDILQDKYSPSQRATMGSLIGFASSLFYGVLGILAGLVADLIGIKLTLLAIELILLTSVFFSWKAVKYNRRT